MEKHIMNCVPTETLWYVLVLTYIGFPLVPAKIVSHQVETAITNQEIVNKDDEINTALEKNRYFLLIGEKIRTKGYILSIENIIL